MARVRSLSAGTITLFGTSTIDVDEAGTRRSDIGERIVSHRASRGQLGPATLDRGR
jgi:hypothetical protein